MRYFLVSVVFLLVCIFFPWTRATECSTRSINLLPTPMSIEERDTCFRTDRPITLQSTLSPIPYLIHEFPFSLTSNPSSGTLHLSLEERPSLGEEGYTLTIDTDTILITAQTATGIYYGLQTLQQLVLDHAESQTLPGLHIIDVPSYTWRGLHLDVARHFMPVNDVKKLLDIMAFHKLNRLQLHLTDDQGWRIEIPSHPELTRIGAWRRGTQQGSDTHGTPPFSDEIPYGGYYTVEDIQTLVSYAAERHIMIIPAIDIPAHTGALIATYPFLSSSQDLLPEVPIQWKVRSDMLDLSEATFIILTDILTDITDLFPAPYIHIGGDELRTNVWQKSPKVHQQLTAKGLNSAEEGFAYFFERIGTTVEELGKTPIGWDEATPYLSQNPITARFPSRFRRQEDTADNPYSGKTPLILSDEEFFYFDYAEDTTDPVRSMLTAYPSQTPRSTEHLYKYFKKRALPEKLPILGVQGYLWSEYLNDTATVLYRTLPRISALSELGWTTQNIHNWEFFQRVLYRQKERYEALSYPYASFSFR